MTMYGLISSITQKISSGGKSIPLPLWRHRQTGRHRRQKTPGPQRDGCLIGQGESAFR
ncbi:MAG: hypothetical protein Ct9H300mP7_1390 [Verrucomicrobiota bacterium]|nr:MAG: hypothetical protein Ct9H300mP7_1390 [Verrucomicrobiota bacterium]